MRNFFVATPLIAVALLGCMEAKAQSDSTTFDDFIHAINMVESSGAKHVGPYNDKGDIARGPFAIHEDYYTDATEYDSSIKGKYSDCDNYDFSLKVVKAYMNRYGKKYIAAKNWKMLAYLHNGGTSFGQNSETSKKNVAAYWAKVKKYL